MKNESKAPAIVKAFELMKHLEGPDEKTLADLVYATGIAKSSALRILRTMISLGIVAQSNSKGAPSYFLLQRLVPNEYPVQFYRLQLLDILSDLAEKRRISVEWFTFVKEGMMLTMKADPPTQEVRVMATEGKCFQWGMELDAVTAVGYAFFDVPLPETFNCYTNHGISERVSSEILRPRIEKARMTGFDEDPFWNDNGVRRMARIVMAREKPVGVLSTARNQRPNDEDLSVQIFRQLKKTAKDIELRCGTALARAAAG